MHTYIHIYSTYAYVYTYVRLRVATVRMAAINRNETRKKLF
jgi:hypothetical protein